MFLLQSCSVYSSRSCSVDEAIRNDSKVKIRTPNNDPYVLKRLERHEGVIYGLTRTNSSTYKRMREQVKDPNNEGKNALILIPDKDLDHIHKKNKGASTAISIGVPVVALGVTAAIAATNVDVNLNWSDN